MDKKSIIMAVLLCFAASSCVKEKLKTTYNSQEDSIDKYITSNMYEKRSGVSEMTGNDTTWTDTLRVVYNGGANRLVLNEGIGEELKPGGKIAFYYAGYTFKGNKSISNLFTTNRKETAAEAKWNLTDYSKVALIISDAHEEIALQIGLQLDRGATYLLAEGSYSHNPKKVVLAAVKKQQLAELKELVVNIDPNAFIIVQEAHQVLGDGFSRYTKDSL